MSIIAKPVSMRTIEWTPALRVGIDSLDHDHRTILIAIGLLENELELHGESDRIGMIAHFLSRLTNLHFAREERLMAALGYPELERHVAEHRDFLRWRDTTLPNPDETKGGLLRDGTIRYLSDWLDHHVREVDMRYKDIFLEREPEVRHALMAAELAMPLSF